MTKFIIRRLLQSIPTFFGITVLSYLIIVAAPGNPVEIMTFGPRTTPEDKAITARRLGLDDSIPVQYIRWLIGDDWLIVDHLQWYQFELEDGTLIWLSEHQVKIDDDGMFELDSETGAVQLTTARQPYRFEPHERTDDDGKIDGRRDLFEPTGVQSIETLWGDNYGILRGDFGNSFDARQNPVKLIFERLPATLELNIATLLVSFLIAIPMGVMAAVNRGGLFDQVTRVLAAVGNAIPGFWLGFLLILTFGSYLHWLPLGGRCEPVRGGCPPIYGRLEYLIMPTIIAAIPTISFLSRYMRTSVLDNVSSDYVRTARAKGLPAQTVWFKHALRNALIPMATFLGPMLAGLLGGAAILETVFAWPGVGRFLVSSITKQDYPVVMASTVIFSILTILGFLLSDILYGLFDPRVRY
jgi:peptide/nickel transport system permease protein